MRENSRGDSIFLVVGSSPDVAETTTRRERLGGNFFAGGQEDGRSYGGDVWAAGFLAGGEDVFLGAETGAASSGDTIVTAGEDDGRSLKAELHELVALALQVGVSTDLEWEVVMWQSFVPGDTLWDSRPQRYHTKRK